MTLTADQYLQIAQGYAQAAADPFVSAERREAFAKKAAWLDFLGRRERGALRSDGNATSGNSDLTASPYSLRSRRSISQLVTMLWLVGAALYLFGTVLFTNFLNFRDTGRQEVASQSTPSREPAPEVASLEAKATEQRGLEPTADQPPAISPDQTSYEAPGLTTPPSLVQQEESHPPDPMEELAAAQPAEVLKVSAEGAIREGPSTSAKKIGTATPGAALQVKAREGKWVQFVEPASGKTGWIHSSVLATALPSGTTTVSTSQADVLAPSKSKLAKKRIRQKPSAPSQASKQRRPGIPALGRRAYAHNPDKVVVLPPRKPDQGFSAKRRMLREGVMSPGLVPPRP